MPAPCVTSDGKALDHTSLVSTDFAVGTTNRTLLLVTNTGDSGTVAWLGNYDTNGIFVDGGQTLTIPTMATADYAGGPSAARAMKLAVSVVNCSNGYRRGGRVTYLNSSQRLPAYEDVPGGGYTWTPIIDGIKNSPYRKRINGETLVHPLQLISYPVDSIEYASFRPFRGTLPSEAFLSHVLGSKVGDLMPQPRPMSIIAYIFEPVADVQDYSVTVRASYYTRWPLTSVPGQSMKMMPTADPKVINHVRDVAEAHANDLVHVAEGSAAALLAPRMFGTARAAGGSMLSALARGATAAMGMAEGAAGELVGAEGVALAEGMVPLLV